MKTLLNFYKLPRPHFYRSPFPGAVVLETTKDRATQGTRWLWWHCRAQKKREERKWSAARYAGSLDNKVLGVIAPQKMEHAQEAFYSFYPGIFLWPLILPPLRHFALKREKGAYYYTIFLGLELRVPISQVRGNVVFAEANGWQIWVLLLLLFLRADSCRLGKPGGQTGWGKVVAVCQSRDERP